MNLIDEIDGDRCHRTITRHLEGGTGNTMWNCAIKISRNGVPREAKKKIITESLVMVIIP